MTGKLWQCPHCLKYVLVERVLIGSEHTLNTFLACWDCMTPEKQDEARARYGLIPPKK
jgi:hypothetical protein